MNDIASPQTLTAQAPRWHLRLLGAVELLDEHNRPTRLPTRAATLLLTRLALAPQRQHPREELVELLWPGVDAETGRNRLRQALSVLRTLLEPPGGPLRPVLVADRRSVSLVADALRSDVQAFLLALSQGHTQRARASYQGELLPGHFDEWVLEERRHLAARAEALAALHDAGQGPDATPAPATPGIEHRLPRYLTRLIGFEADGAALAALLAEQRLVVLRGPGGAGKTRLAVEVARALAQRADGRLGSAGPTGLALDWVAFVPLAACHTRQQMLDALLYVLRQEGAPNLSQPFDQVLQALAGRRVLLVLDNFEQLVEAGRADLAHWLSALPGLQLLVTSRRALGLDGEAEHSLAALPLPQRDASLQAHVLNPAVALFADRARAVRADFHLSQRNRQQVADIVRGLHGLPLAIELAAARVRSLGLADMQAMLQDTGQGGSSLGLLSRSGPRAADDARHASMLRVLQWSWQQLSIAEQTLLALLSSCDGGASLAMLVHLQHAAEDTRAGLTQVALGVDELLASSVAYRSESAAGQSRYHAFETMREFVFHQAGADGVARLRAQHARAVAAWAATLGHEPDLALAHAEWPNLLRALARGAEPAAKPADAEQAIHTVLAARWVLDDMSLPASALDHLRAAAALAHPHPHPQQDALLQSLLAMHSFHAGQREAAQQHAQAALAATPDSAAQRAEVLRNAAQVLVRLSSEPLPLLGLVQECLALAREHGLPDIEARALTLLGLIEYRAHREASAVLHHYQQALALWRRHGPRARAASGMASLAIQLGALHRVPEQLLLLGEARAQAAQWGQQRLLAYCMSVTGYALTDLRRYAQAADMFGQCLQMDWDHAHWREWFYVLWNLPRTLAYLRRPQVAAQLMGFAENFYAQRFGVLGPEDLPEARRTRRLVAAQAGRAQAQAWWQEGAALSMAQAMALAQNAISRD